MPESRKPAAFRLDDPGVALGDAPVIPGRTVVVIPEIDPAPEAAPPATMTDAPSRGVGWGTLFWSSVGGLVVLALGLAVTRLVEDLFAHGAALGWVGIALTALAALAALAIGAREVAGLARLRAVEDLRTRATAAVASDDRDAARAVVRDLMALTAGQPALARARTALAAHAREIIDGSDLVRLAERELMGPLDDSARRIVAEAAKRVSVATAVSPRALLDMAVVIVTALSVARRLSELYGGRPGRLALVRLAGRMFGHLAITGGMAAGESLLQQVLGHGLAARVSTRLGEGVLNGLMTARLGLAAIAATRPLPFLALPEPKLADVATDLFRGEDPTGERRTVPQP